MFGARIKSGSDEKLSIEGIVKPKTPKNIVNCNGSGSTMRFLAPVFSLADGATVLTGNRSLRSRPMQPLLDALRQLGAQCFSTKQDGTAPLVIRGRGMRGGRVVLRGDVSSQFVSGLLFGCPKAENETKIDLETQLESKPYVAMTIDVLNKHGIGVDHSPDHEHFAVPCGQEYHTADRVIEGDYSSAAFLLAASAIIKSNVKVTNLPEHSLQGDKIIVDILRTMGAEADFGDGGIEIAGSVCGLASVRVDLRNAPDLVPVCAVLACFSEGETALEGVERLRYKESDRITCLITEIRKMGGKILAEKDALIIEGMGKLHGARVRSHSDHRIAMALAVAGLGAEGMTTIHGIECVRKSYVGFVDDLKGLGGKIFGG